MFFVPSCGGRNVIGFKLAGDPRLLMRAINPGEAALFDRAAGVQVRFRLGGYTFPPSIYYKVPNYMQCGRRNTILLYRGELLRWPLISRTTSYTIITTLLTPIPISKQSLKCDFVVWGQTAMVIPSK